MTDEKPTLEYSSPDQASMSEPRRLAARISMILGVLCLGLAGLFGMNLVNQGFIRDSSGRILVNFAIIQVAVTTSSVIFGVIYIVGSVKIRKFSRAWPLVVMILAGVHAALGAIRFVLALFQVSGAGAERAGYVVSIALIGLFTAAVIQLIIKCMQVRREDTAGR